MDRTCDFVRLHSVEIALDGLSRAIAIQSRARLLRVGSGGDASSVLQPARLIHPERDSRTGAMRVNLPPYPLHLVAARDDRLARTEAVVGVALLHPVGGEKGDAEGTVGIGADDRLVVRRHRPGEGLLGVGVGRRRSAPG